MVSPPGSSPITIRPQPHDPAELRRWEWTGLARRILYGQWRADLERRVQCQVGSVRREAWGIVDLSANLFRQVWDALSVLFDRWPVVGGEGADRLMPYVHDAGLWPLMSRVQRDTLALREMLLRVDVVGDRVVYRSVFPDFVICRDDPQIPGRLIEVREQRLRERVATGRLEWTWDVLELAGPSYRILADDGTDLTDEYLGGSQSGEAYPYRMADGTPVLPYVMFHAAATSRLWDPYASVELIEGTLNLGVKYTFLGHQERNSAWSQRNAINLQLAGTGIADEDRDGKRRHEVVADPSLVLLWDVVNPEAGQPSLQQWSSPSSPIDAQEAISMYERRLASFAGINPADLIRMSGDPRSGYAVSVSQAAIRAAQRRYEPQFRAGISETLNLTAILLNRAADAGAVDLGSPLPESGYTIAFQGVPLSPEEQRARRENLVSLIGAGLLDPIDAYRELNPGTTETEARDALRRIRESRATLGPI